MTGFLIHNGHLAWPWFFAIVYTGLVWLGGDLAWRRITVPARWIGLALVALWLIGLVVIFAVA